MVAYWAEEDCAPIDGDFVCRPGKVWYINTETRDRCRERRERNQESIDIMALNIMVNDIEDYWIGYDH